MNVGLIIYGSLALVSGGYLYDRLLVEHLRRRGTRVEVLALPRRNDWRHLADNFASPLPRALEASAPDLLLQDELCHPSLFHMNMRLRKSFKGPIIAVVHHLRSSETRAAWHNALYRRVEKLYLERVDGFIFNSETTHSVVRGVTGMDRPSVVAYPGGDHLTPRLSVEKIAGRCLLPGPLKILFTGNVIPRKGLHTLIAALGRLSNESWQLTVAGSLSVDPSYVRRIARLVAGSGLDKRITLTDAISPGALVGLLDSHHCLAVPSFYEGFGIAYLEAMGFGMPVIASTSGAIPEVIQDGREGFLVRAGDAAALAESIGRLIRDRNLLLTMSLAARKRYLGHPSWADGAARVDIFLREMIRQKKTALADAEDRHDHSG